MLLLHIFDMIYRFPSVGSSVFFFLSFLFVCFYISGCACRLSLVVESWVYSLVVLCRLLTVVASLAEILEHGLQ